MCFNLRHALPKYSDERVNVVVLKKDILVDDLDYYENYFFIELFDSIRNGYNIKTVPYGKILLEVDHPDNKTRT